MRTGTNGQVHPRSSKSKRDSIIYGLAGALFALIGIRSFFEADAWYLYMGACIMMVAAATFVAQSIRSLRVDEYATSE